MRYLDLLRERPVSHAGDDDANGKDYNHNDPHGAPRFGVKGLLLSKADAGDRVETNMLF
jgi:hypothetical protein